ncbi:MAG: winged helix-turn-helix domain-containing protein [Candidatus Heimdallarchaeota archaeon]
MTKRGWYDIILEILKAAKYGKIKTHIMHQANLSHRQINKYIRLLMDKSLIENLTAKQKKPSRIIYRTTVKGLKLIEILEYLKDLCESPAKIGEGELSKRDKRIVELNLLRYIYQKKAKNKTYFEDNIV